MRILLSRRPGGAGLFVCLIALAGCAGDPQVTGAKVSGTVKHKGKVVTGGQLLLISVSDPNKSMSAKIDGDGKFEMPNAPVGEVKVVVDTEAAKYDISAMGKGNPNVDPSVYGKPMKYMAIDKKYGSADTTDFKITVKKEDQTLAIDLP